MSKTYCSERRKRLSVNEIKHLSILDYMNLMHINRNECNSRIRSFNRIWNKHLIKSSCTVCQYSSHIELAHIKAIREFDIFSKIGDINDESNILVLCPNHHWEFDNGILSIEEILGKNFY